MTESQARDARDSWGAWLAKCGGWLAAALITLYVGRYAYRSGISVVSADSWDFVRGFVNHYNEGTLSLFDFFGKRPLGYDHSQPIQRAVLWLHMKLFDMDFGVEGAIGCLFAAGLAFFCSSLAKSALRESRGGEAIGSLFTVSIFAAIFSLNARSVFDWSLVTLIFADILGAALLVAYAHHCLRHYHRLRLFFAAFIACALMDTIAILAILSTSVLLVVASFEKQRRRKEAWLVVALLAAAALYKIAYALLFPINAIETASRWGLVENLLRLWPDSWKALVVPMGGAIVSPSRLGLQFPGAVWQVLAAAAAIMGTVSAWFWLRFFRFRRELVPFTAAGLMLISYSSVAGVVLMRVPTYGFDYLLQPRYVLFYTLQLVALLLMASDAWAKSSSVLTRSVIASGALAVIVLWGIYAKATAADEKFVRAYNQQMADQIHALWLNPSATPVPCSPNIYLCSWSPAIRVETLHILEEGPWNVFSPEFVHRHRLRWNKQRPEE